MRNGELEDRSEDVTQNAIQRDKEMKYMKKRVSDTKESKKIQQKSIRNFRSNIWIIQNWFKTWNFTFRKLSESQDGKIHSYIPITVKQHKWKKKS